MGAAEGTKEGSRRPEQRRGVSEGGRRGPWKRLQGLQACFGKLGVSGRRVKECRGANSRRPVGEVMGSWGHRGSHGDRLAETAVGVTRRPGDLRQQEPRAGAGRLLSPTNNSLFCISRSMGGPGPNKSGSSGSRASRVCPVPPPRSAILGTLSHHQVHPTPGAPSPGLPGPSLFEHLAPSSMGGGTQAPRS